jgi:hypothetical protein
MPGNKLAGEHQRSMNASQFHCLLQTTSLQTTSHFTYGFRMVNQSVLEHYKAVTLIYHRRLRQL